MTQYRKFEQAIITDDQTLAQLTQRWLAQILANSEESPKIIEEMLQTTREFQAVCFDPSEVIAYVFNHQLLVPDLPPEDLPTEGVPQVSLADLIG